MSWCRHDHGRRGVVLYSWALTVTWRERTPPDMTPSSPTSSPPQHGSSGSSHAGSPQPSSTRERFGSRELAIVLSHYDIGTIKTIQDFPRGSRKAPKLILRSSAGTYLLKRRAGGKNDPFKVAFCHNLQLCLARKQFPLPRLIGTKQDNNSMLQLNNYIYELFEFISGTIFDNSPLAATDGGKTLALFHKLLLDYQPQYEPPQGSYHGARCVARSMEAIPSTLAKVDPRNATEQADSIQKTIRFLHASYNEAALRVNEMGLSDWPLQIVHSDWHPGNMLFRGSRVVAVIDYDAARIQQRVIDVANGALQFSILGGGEDPATWPSHLDETRFTSFLGGYDSVPGCVVARAELRTVPWLMIEALIAESVIPIAATGSFARMDGVGFLMMVERKVRWLQQRAEDLAHAIDH